MRRLLKAALAASFSILLALPVGAQQPVQLGGTGASNTGGDDKMLIGNGAGQFVERTLTNCTGTDAALQYDAAGNTMGCATISGGYTPRLPGVPIAPLMTLFVSEAPYSDPSRADAATAVGHT